MSYADATSCWPAPRWAAGPAMRHAAAGLRQPAAQAAVDAAKEYAGTEITIVWEAGLQSLDPLNFSGPNGRS